MPEPEDTKRAHEALVAAVAQMKLILDSPSIIIFSLDREYRYTSFNRNHAETIRRIWGIEIEAGLCMLDVIGDAADREKARRSFDRAIRDGAEFTLVEAYGDERRERSWYENRYCPTRQVDGTIIGVTVFVTDVTDRIKAQEEKLNLERKIQQAARLESLGVLAGGIAHDFNNLLVGVLAASSSLLDELSERSPLRPSLDLIRKSAERAADLTRQLLAYSGRGHYIVSAVDLTGVVRDILDLLSTSISKKALLEIELDSGLPAIEADATQVQQIIMNLVINASEALDDRAGRIRVRTGRTVIGDGARPEGLPFGVEAAPGEYAYVEVRDSGQGMSAETQARIFDPFYSTKSTGRGLGLAAVLGIVKGHRGWVRVDSERDRGTSFVVAFPLSARPAPKTAPERPRAYTKPRTGTRVLLVDDEEIVRRVGRYILERADVAVVEARDGAEALKLLDDPSSPFDVVLLDMNMPRLAGEEVLKTMRSLGVEVPVVLMSGYSDKDVARRVVDLGPTGFLAKPFRSRELLDVMARTLEGPDESRAAEA